MRLLTALIMTFCLGLSLPVQALTIAGLRPYLQQEESRLGARIGVAVLDAEGQPVFGYRSGERFPLNSTHKVLACAALLADVQRKTMRLEQPVTLLPQALVDYSPITAARLAPETISLRELCRAAVSYSDNTAANAVLTAIGGPGAVTRFMRDTGDNVTRLDRPEPALNEAAPGDHRDTTTPASIVATLRRLLVTDILTPPHRSLLQGWMMDDQVADDLLRAALPTGWRIADKTGAGGYGSRSIIAAVYPANSRPFYIAVYLTQTTATLQQSNRVIAHIGKVIFH